MADATTTSLPLEALDCIVCSKPFNPIYKGRGRPPRLCSEECRQASQKRYASEYRKRSAQGIRVYKVPVREPNLTTFDCEECGTSATMELAHQGNRFCSAACRLSHHGERRKTEPLAPRACRACGSQFIPKGKVHHYCSDDCRYRVWYPKKMAARIARLVGNVDPIVVFERDGWKCHLCKKPTPRHLRGTREPRAPELDHVQSLKDGGPHTYANTACACRQCNMKKGSRSSGQLTLI